MSLKSNQDSTSHWLDTIHYYTQSIPCCGSRTVEWFVNCDLTRNWEWSIINYVKNVAFPVSCTVMKKTLCGSHHSKETKGRISSCITLVFNKHWKR